jgi:hypothetical protein
VSDGNLLPAGFEALEHFVAFWAVQGSSNRAQRRTDSSESERVAFYSAAKDLAPDALEYLDRKPVAQLDEKERRLMDLMLSLCHVSLAVESQRDDEERHSKARAHMKITRSSADRNG